MTTVRAFWSQDGSHSSFRVLHSVLLTFENHAPERPQHSSYCWEAMMPQEIRSALQTELKFTHGKKNNLLDIYRSQSENWKNVFV